MIIATSITENYLWRAEREWLPSVNEFLPELNPVCLCQGFTPSQEVQARYPSIMFLPYSLSQAKLPHNNGCIQHGDFVDVIEAPEEELILFMDADIVVQRPMETQEREYLQKFGATTTASSPDIQCDWFQGQQFGEFTSIASYLSIPHIIRLFSPNVPEVLSQKYRFSDKLAINAAILVMQKGTFRRLRDRYVVSAPELFPYLHHIAKQQLLISCLIQDEDFQVLPYTFYLSSCWGVHPLANRQTRTGEEWRHREIVTFEGKTVLFRHLFDD